MRGVLPAAGFVHGADDWTRTEVQALFDMPFSDLLFQAQSVHRTRFDPNEIQVSTLLSIKTGACAEDCAYCSQSARYDTGLARERLLPLAERRLGGYARHFLPPLWRRLSQALAGQQRGVPGVHTQPPLDLGQSRSGLAPGQQRLGQMDACRDAGRRGGGGRAPAHLR